MTNFKHIAKTLLLAVAIIIVFLSFMSCVDVIRGNKNLTIIQKTFDSQINLYSDTEATVQTDKDYTDSGNVDVQPSK